MSTDGLADFLVAAQADYNHDDGMTPEQHIALRLARPDGIAALAAVEAIRDGIAAAAADTAYWEGYERGKALPEHLRHLETE